MFTLQHPRSDPTARPTIVPRPSHSVLAISAILLSLLCLTLSPPVSKADGPLLVDLTPEGDWEYVEVMRRCTHQTFFAAMDHSYSSRLYTTSDGISLTDVTPVGPWAELHCAYQDAGQPHVVARDHARNARLYRTTDGAASYADVTPEGAWRSIDFEAEIGGKLYFRLEGELDEYWLYVTSDGHTFADVTPIEAPRSAGYVTQSGGYAYFGFYDGTGEYLYALSEDGTFTVMEMECLGLCEVAPAVFVDGEPHVDVTPDSLSALLDGLE